MWLFWNDTQDIFQQTSLVLWEKFDSFETGSNFAAWSCRAARYTAMNFLRDLGLSTAFLPQS
jgi:RNA polymerase sigma-70 factor (ECF subfamily)